MAETVRGCPRGDRHDVCRRRNADRADAEADGRISRASVRTLFSLDPETAGIYDGSESRHDRCGEACRHARRRRQPDQLSAPNRSINGLLQTIGRIHEPTISRSMAVPAKPDFTNLSIDLMFGLPGQTLEHAGTVVTRRLRWILPHYSLYSLKVEENTLFHTLYEKRASCRCPKKTRKCDVWAHYRRLARSGYRQYEISNFARPGYESRHNTAYWRNETYYGWARAPTDTRRASAT